MLVQESSCFVAAAAAEAGREEKIVKEKKFLASKFVLHCKAAKRFESQRFEEIRKARPIRSSNTSLEKLYDDYYCVRHDCLPSF